jgi:phenylpyruvate tautomerase PptA (4-oxalocrotonate tautomerase family)
MPSVQIEVRRAYSPQQETAIIEAVHGALRDTFKLLPTDRTVRLIVHEPERFACPPDRSQPDRFTLITIDCFPGRTLDTKRALYREIVERLAPIGIPPDHTKIVLREVPTENWGIRSGHAACDIDLGFKIDV